MSTSSAADWCRAVLEEVSPSPINSVPPLPANVPVPPPPPPVFAGTSKQVASTAPSSSSWSAPSSAAWTGAAATNVAQPSAQYQAYYNQYYSQSFPTQQTATTSYSQYQQSPQTQTQTQSQYLQQPQQQQTQAQYQQQSQQQQQAMYYQQPSYTSVVQHGTAAWNQANAVHQAEAQAHGRAQGLRGEAAGSYHQQGEKDQNYIQQQYTLQQYAQQQQSYGNKASNTATPSLGENKAVVTEMKKPHKSRFSAAPDSSIPLKVAAVSVKKDAETSENTKPPAGDSAMPSNWPTSLKNFVARSFALCKTDNDRKDISQALEKLINKVAFDGRVSTHRWDLEDISTTVIPVLPATVRPTSKPVEKVPPKVAAKAKAEPAVQTAAYRQVTSAPPNNGSNGTYGSGTQGTYGSNNQNNYGNNNTQGNYGNDNNQDTYGANNAYGQNQNNNNSFGGSVSVDYGSVTSNSRHASAAPSPHSVSDVSKKRKNKWDNDSTSSNGDAASVSSFYGVQGKQKVNKNKVHKASSLDSNDGEYGALSFTNMNKVNVPANKIMERPLTKAEQAMREKRASRFKESEEERSMAGQAEHRVNPMEAQLQIQFGTKNKLKKRVIENSSYRTSDDNHSSVTVGAEFDFEKLIVIGTCQKLEKDYFRLTSAPIPNTVRPEWILRESLDLLKKKWEEGSVEYIYMCSQFKSIRQDLTVQHIQNDLTVEVYECHARVALECRDLNEYNQCQTQLKQLYCTVKIKKLPKCGSEMEFTAYRILYYVYLQGNKKYQNGSSDLADIMSSLSQEAFRDPAVSHALSVRQSIQLDNFHKFFQLYRATPNLGKHILDLMIDNKRLLALQKIVRVYKPSVPVAFVSSILNFDSEEKGKEFMTKAGCVLEDTTEINSLGISMIHLGINTKDSVVDTSIILHEVKLLL